MAEDEDSVRRADGEQAARGPGGALKAWFEQELTTLPPATDEVTALRLLVSDLEKVRELFGCGGRDDHSGHASYYALAKTMVRFCHALGRRDLASIPRILAKDLTAVCHGKPTYALH